MRMTSERLRVVVNGAQGHMGSLAAKTVDAAPDLALV